MIARIATDADDGCCLHELMIHVATDLATQPQDTRKGRVAQAEYREVCERAQDVKRETRGGVA